MHQKKEMNEAQLIQKLREGDRQALALLWQRHSQQVLNLAFRTLRDRDIAEDILMDVFVAVPNAIQQFHGRSSIGTWLYRMTYNACLMKIRADKLHRQLESDNLEQITSTIFGHETEDTSSDPELLEKGLAQLPPDTRAMLWLKDAEGLNLQELTEIFHMPDGTIKARLSRARHSILQFFQGAKSL